MSQYRSGARHVMVKSPTILPFGLSIGLSTVRPTVAGTVFDIRRSSQASALGPRTSNFAKVEISNRPAPLRTARHSSPTGPNQFARLKEGMSRALFGYCANQSGY